MMAEPGVMLAKAGSEVGSRLESNCLVGAFPHKTMDELMLPRFDPAYLFKQLKEVRP